MYVVELLLLLFVVTTFDFFFIARRNCSLCFGVNCDVTADYQREFKVQSVVVALVVVIY